MNAFFNSFGLGELLAAKYYSNCIFRGMKLLQKCKSLEPQVYSQIHKGTPYYWMGIGAFLMYDFERAVFFIDAAVSEDKRRGDDLDAGPSPAMLFLTINPDIEHQAALNLVLATQTRVNDCVGFYNEKPDEFIQRNPFNIGILRNVFLKPAIRRGPDGWRSLSSALISFLLEMDNIGGLFEVRECMGTYEPMFLHLFKGCVLFESLINCNPFIDVNKYHGRGLGALLQGVQKQLGIPNDIKSKSADLQGVVDAVPGFGLPISSSIEFTARLRNSIGQNIGQPINMTHKQYYMLFINVALSCLHAISCLYRQPEYQPNG